MKTTKEIWNDYHAKLTTFIRGRVPSDVVDDLLQDVFLKVHSKIHTLRDHRMLESWLYQVTRNLIYDYYRAKEYTETLPKEIEQTQLPEEDSAQRELSQCLNSMITDLPTPYREAIQLSEIQRESQRQVAFHAGISLSGAKSRVQRGRLMLRDALKDCCSFEFNSSNQLISYEPKSTAYNCCQDC
ncbi:RNA polymerase sigma factor SigZ [Rubellicoccus peritrichatus]|uniref:RNA polymerase sigma factor SigZ n=1 Tax=Rubellicoccus peritrichatus TaxID=3080537 RepID=UPI0031F2F54B